jgi:hypothetical protein
MVKRFIHKHIHYLKLFLKRIFLARLYGTRSHAQRVRPGSKTFYAGASTTGIGSKAGMYCKYK